MKQTKGRSRVIVTRWRGLNGLDRKYRLSLGLGITLIILGLASTNVSAQPSPKLDLEKYHGKVVYLDFWASWCGPCKLSFPYMEDLKAVHAKDAFAIIAVNVDHSRARADDFLSQAAATLPILYDPHGEIAAQFHVKEMPTSVLIDRNGRIRYVHNGFFADKIPEYEQQISELLNEK